MQAGGLYTGTQMGVMAVQALGEWAMNALDDDEDDEVARDIVQGTALYHDTDGSSPFGSLLPWYNRNSAYSIISVDQENKAFEYYDWSYLNPYGGIMTALHEFAKDTETAINMDDSGRAALTVARAFRNSVASVFLGDEVLFGEFVKRTNNKYPVTYEDDDFVTKWANKAQETLQSDGDFDSAALDTCCWCA